MINPKEIKMLDNWTYLLPTYKITNEGVEDGMGAIIRLCRGNKADETLPRQEGFFTESILMMCAAYLEAVNQGELENTHTTAAIRHILLAVSEIDARAADRKSRGVQQTYKP